MPDLQQFEYRDPLKVMLAREERSCKGCMHEQRIDDGEVFVWICKLDKGGRKRKHGTRCKEYKER